jgi:hypothetical protein
MRSSLKFKIGGRTISVKRSKAQFFILSAIVIVGIVYFVSKWSEPYTILDTSSAATAEELFIFNNIKSKIIETARISKSCEELSYNLDEYESFVGDYLLSKNKLYISHKFESPCLTSLEFFPAVVLVNMTLMSSERTVQSYFRIFWPA